MGIEKGLVATTAAPTAALPATLPTNFKRTYIIFIDRDSISIAESNKALELRKSSKAYFNMGKYNESLVDLTESLDIEPNTAFALRIREDTYRIMSKYKELLAEVAGLSPRYSAAHSTRYA
ncbi:hypothetical protein C2G38_2183188 [Gigaspora rosea]|uniref:Uncharacterized protein n=1 Tax=Gigaspora rosea TaxID=44941 RepID=A0A397V934_9GLOM|nr:hypothetical protein C2G38_2183188 [Gigaspora rosea]